jgi:phenylacetate-CoA ligase
MAQKKQSTRLIDILPPAALAIGVNLMGLYYRFMRYSTDMEKVLHEYKGLEKLDAVHIERLQLQRLRTILAAADNTAFYRPILADLKIRPNKLTSLEELTRLPILDKSDLRKHGKKMINPYYKGKIVRKVSGGTTGEPVEYFQPQDMAYTNAYAMLYQYYSWHGLHPLCRRATLAGRYLGRSRKGVAIRNWFENQLLLGVHSLTSKTSIRYAQAINSFRPALVQAHPSALLLLKQFLNELGHKAPRIPLVAYTAETLYEPEREELQSWLGGATIFGTYGSGENVVAGGECPELSGYHLHPAIGICELLPTENGKEILGTSLLNDYMPLIRFRTGDLADEMSSNPCTCGCTWPRLIGLRGRVDEVITSSAGAPIAPVVLRTGISAIGTINSPYTITQRTTPKHYCLEIFSQELKVASEDIAPVINYLKQVLGDESIIEVRISPIDELLTLRGKHRIVKRERTCVKT